GGIRSRRLRNLVEWHRSSTHVRTTHQPVVFMSLAARRDALGFGTLLAAMIAARALAADDPAYDPAAESAKVLAKMQVRADDCPQFGVSHYRNNVSAARGIPTSW